MRCIGERPKPFARLFKTKEMYEIGHPAAPKRGINYWLSEPAPGRKMRA